MKVTICAAILYFLQAYLCTCMCTELSVLVDLWFPHKDNFLFVQHECVHNFHTHLLFNMSSVWCYFIWILNLIMTFQQYLGPNWDQSVLSTSLRVCPAWSPIHSLIRLNVFLTLAMDKNWCLQQDFGCSHMCTNSHFVCIMSKDNISIFKSSHSWISWSPQWDVWSSDRMSCFTNSTFWWIQCSAETVLSPCTR